jgi:hypothetical protein
MRSPIILSRRSALADLSVSHGAASTRGSAISGATLQEAEAQATRERPGMQVRNPLGMPCARPSGRTIVTVGGDDEAANDAMLVRLLGGDHLAKETCQPRRCRTPTVVSRQERNLSKR